MMQTAWIKVADQLPPIGTNVLICWKRKGSGIVIANLDADGDWSDSSYDTWMEPMYWAWMPLHPSTGKKKKAKRSEPPIVLKQLKRIEHHE